MAEYPCSPDSGSFLRAAATWHLLELADKVCAKKHPSDAELRKELLSAALDLRAASSTITDPQRRRKEKASIRVRYRELRNYMLNLERKLFEQTKELWAGVLLEHSKSDTKQ